MTLADLSIKRPVFISCIVILMLALGLLSMGKLSVDLFPDVTFPVVTVTTPYPGAGPKEIETLVSQPLEDEISTLPGIKTLSSQNREGVSIVVAQFTLSTDVKYAEQLIRDRVSAVKAKLPVDVLASTIRRIDPADQPILSIAVSGDLPPAQMFDFVDNEIRPKLEQVDSVGLVQILGGRKREIHVNLDREKLKEREISASAVANRLAIAGQDIPVGKVEKGDGEVVYRSVGQFSNLKDIESSIVNFFANDVPVKVSDLGDVTEALEDEKTRTSLNGKPGLLVSVYRQSGSNTVKVADNVTKRVAQINKDISSREGNLAIAVVRDTSRMIRVNVADVKESIFIGIILTIVVVYFFLGSGRSTIITGLALPNSLLGAFILMYACGFSINVMTLLALSLAVGLLIDDAIVVRENIYRHIEEGASPEEASRKGTHEVTLAVIATTLTVIAVFGPIAFLDGVVGQFFKEFGLTICFAMAISLFDALTIAPMLSTYFAGASHASKKTNTGLWTRITSPVLALFERSFQAFSNWYQRILVKSMHHPLTVLGAALGIFVLSLGLTAFIPKTFIGAQDFGEFLVSLDMPPGTSLDKMHQTAREVDSIIRAQSECDRTVMTVGTKDGEANQASIFVAMVPASKRKINTSQFKDILREKLKPYAAANPQVKDIDAVGGGQRPFNVNIIGPDLDVIEKYSMQVFEKVKHHPALKDVDISFRPGKPEFQVKIDKNRAERMGVSSVLLGQELRTQIEGATPAVYRIDGREYDIRVRLRPDQRNLEENFASTYIPNINQSLIRVRDVAEPVKTASPATINRQDRGRYVQISADVAPNGPGLGGAINDFKRIFNEELPLPAGTRFEFVGQAENFQELMVNMAIAAGLGVLFIYLVLASLYESFITPFTIMLVLPLAACGAFAALFVTGKALDLFTMIGCIMLIGVATKNSILLVDCANQLIKEGKSFNESMLEAARLRLRPILMTTIALIAGMVPIAIGLNEASKQRSGMGIAVIGGLLSSTFLTLLVIPAAYSYIERFRSWCRSFAFKK